MKLAVRLTVVVCLQLLDSNHQSSTDGLFSFLTQSERYADDAGWKTPIIHIDGPCGAPAQNYKDYKILLLVVNSLFNVHCRA